MSAAGDLPSVRLILETLDTIRETAVDMREGRQNTRDGQREIWDYCTMIERYLGATIATIDESNP